MKINDLHVLSPEIKKSIKLTRETIMLPGTNPLKPIIRQEIINNTRIETIGLPYGIEPTEMVRVTSCDGKIKEKKYIIMLNKYISATKNDEILSDYVFDDIFEKQFTIINSMQCLENENYWLELDRSVWMSFCESILDIAQKVEDNIVRPNNYNSDLRGYYEYCMKIAELRKCYFSEIVFNKYCKEKRMKKNKM